MKFTRFTSIKRGLSRFHAMLHFHTITPIMLLFHESRALKKGLITPSRNATLSCHHASYLAVLWITPWKNGQSRHHANRWGASSFECFQYLTLKQIIWKTKTSFKKLRLKKVLSTINLNASLPCQKPMLMTVKGINHKNNQAQ